MKECLCGKKANTIIHGMGECCINNKDWDCIKCGKAIDFIEFVTIPTISL
ncbi:MAG: hypothetical protein ACRCX8_18375 [Sarcina sp.]